MECKETDYIWKLEANKIIANQMAKTSTKISADSQSNEVERQSKADRTVQLCLLSRRANSLCQNRRRCNQSCLFSRVQPYLHFFFMTRTHILRYTLSPALFNYTHFPWMLSILAENGDGELLWEWFAFIRIFCSSPRSCNVYKVSSPRLIMSTVRNSTPCTCHDFKILFTILLIFTNTHTQAHTIARVEANPCCRRRFRHIVFLQHPRTWKSLEQSD